MQPIGMQNSTLLTPPAATMLPAALDVQPGSNPDVEHAQKVRDAFTQFFGETFYGQLLKAMRSTVGKPAYFHGGRAEEIFQGQLNQQMAEEMTTASASRLAKPMFEHQFPRLAAILKEAKQEGNAPRTRLDISG